MKELSCRSPATIVPLRPVTLRPYLSVSLPSWMHIALVATRLSIAYRMNGWDYQTSGK